MPVTAKGFSALRDACSCKLITRTSSAGRSWWRLREFPSPHKHRKTRQPVGRELAVAVRQQTSRRWRVAALGVGEAAAEAEAATVGGFDQQRACHALQPALAGHVGD